MKEKYPFEIAKEAIVTEVHFDTYSVTWKCKKGHSNHTVILGGGVEHDVCLTCGKHYEFNIDPPKSLETQITEELTKFNNVTITDYNWGLCDAYKKVLTMIKTLKNEKE